MRLCSVEGCGKKYYAKGYCKKHYGRVLKHGSTQLPIKVKEPKICKVEGCNKPHEAKGYCSAHYSQMQRHGKIFDSARYPPNEIIRHKDFAEIIICDTNGKPKLSCKISLKDIKLAKKHRWCSVRNYIHTSVRNKDGSKTLHSLHRMLMGDPEGMFIDHINGDTLDNRRSNLRIASPAQNVRNRHKNNSNNTSGVTGVCWDARDNRWRSRIQVDGKMISLGYFSDFNNAVAARKKAEKTYYKDFAPKGDFT